MSNNPSSSTLQPASIIKTTNASIPNRKRQRQVPQTTAVNNGPPPTSYYAASVQSSYVGAEGTSQNEYLTSMTMSGGDREPEGEEDSPLVPEQKKKKLISPFDPEAIVPLPYQLDEMGTGTTVWKRNERERCRVRMVNEGYERLRAQLPFGGLFSSDRRLSKVDTLRLAIDYIHHMECLLANPLHDAECQCFLKTLISSSGGAGGGSGSQHGGSSGSGGE